MMNRICLYSNGLGVFAREYTLEKGEPLKIALPVPTQTLDEAIASIGVFGDVTLSEPPNFAPVNRTQRGIELDANDVVKSVARTLRGATVEVVSEGKTLRGKLAGLQEFKEQSAQVIHSRFRIVLFEESGAMRTLSSEAITSLKFTDSTVQAEIDKALQRAFEQVKPDSSFINLTLTPNSHDATDAVVQYALANMGAWKIGYRLRCTEGKWELEGQAVVDNSTDDAWDNVLISVVSGQPISFETDIAEIRPVQRSRVNIVDDVALGSYEMADAMYGIAASAEMPEERMRGGVSRAYAAYDLAMPAPSTKAMKRAVQETAEVKETSEVVEYTAKSPISLAANQSAVIPMFGKELSEAKKLLVYNDNQHRTRAYRAVEFVNEAGHGLGRGVVTLFDDGMYIGKAILKETGKGEKQILPYALEPRVVVAPPKLKHSSHVSAIRISKGVVVTETGVRVKGLIILHNPMPESFLTDVEFALRHDNLAVTLSTKETAAVTKTEQGVRIRFTLPAETTVQLETLETAISRQSVELKDTLEAHWFSDYLFTHDKTLADDPIIQECIALQKERDRILEQKAEIDRAIKTILEEQERLKGLIKVGGLTEDMEEWRRTLAANERTIKEQKQRIPELNAQADAVKKRLMEALGRLAISWQAKTAE
jgi:hypothetical protein